MKLTEQELRLAIQCVSQTSVTVAQSPQLVALVNKMSVMVDQIQKAPAKTSKKK